MSHEAHVIKTLTGQAEFMAGTIGIKKEDLTGDQIYQYAQRRLGKFRQPDPTETNGLYAQHDQQIFYRVLETDEHRAIFARLHPHIEFPLITVSDD